MWSNRKVRKFRAGAAGATSQWDVIETLIQSAAIYSAALASLLGTYVAGSNAQYVCLDILQPLIVRRVLSASIILLLTVALPFRESYSP